MQQGLVRKRAKHLTDFPAYNLYSCPFDGDASLLPVLLLHGKLVSSSMQQGLVRKHTQRLTDFSAHNFNLRCSSYLGVCHGRVDAKGAIVVVLRGVKHGVKSLAHCGHQQSRCLGLIGDCIAGLLIHWRRPIPHSMPVYSCIADAQCCTACIRTDPVCTGSSQATFRLVPGGSLGRSGYLICLMMRGKRCAGPPCHMN